METFINGSNLLEINNEVVNKTIAIRKARKISLPDAIIAATAFIYDLILITSNSADFKNIPGLQIIDPRNL
jgi:predicted nucleic acid-binding protein